MSQSQALCEQVFFRRGFIVNRRYYCLSRLLDGVQDNFTFAQKGIQRKVFSLKRLTRRLDPELCDHLDALGIDFLHFGFRWMNCLLMRELNLECVLRLWDACVPVPKTLFLFL